jgi:hypothetical protein
MSDSTQTLDTLNLEVSLLRTELESVKTDFSSFIDHVQNVFTQFSQVNYGMTFAMANLDISINATNRILERAFHEPNTFVDPARFKAIVDNVEKEAKVQAEEAVRRINEGFGANQEPVVPPVDDLQLNLDV